MTDSAWTVLAYLDPGMGSLVIQVAIAALLSTGYVFRHYVGGPFRWVWHKVRPSSRDPIPPAEQAPVTGTAAPAVNHD